MKDTLDKSFVLGGISNLPNVKLNSADMKAWDETRAAALWVLPHITDVWYAMMVDKEGTLAWFTDKLDTCATDDKYIYINPTFYFKHPLEERVFIAAHEVLHAIFNHCGLMYHLDKEGRVKYPDGDVLPYSHDLMNIAMDCLINAMLVESNVGGKPEKVWYLPQLIPSTTNALEAYRTLFKHWKIGEKLKGRNGKDGEGSGGMTINIPDNEQGKSFDIHLRPGQARGLTPSEAESERNPQEWEDCVNAAMQSARAAGRLPANLERIFKISMEVPTPWEDLITINVAQSIGREGHSWMFLDGEFALRGIGFPGRVRYGCKCIVIIVDTSGSINQRTTNMFLSNTAVIIAQVKPKELIFGECDAQIHRWEIIEDINDLQGKVHGGGGTSFRPPFQRLADEDIVPDVLIYFTDLDAWDGFPPEPDFPVIWACTEEGKKAPYGTTIYVPPLKEEPDVYL